MYISKATFPAIAYTDLPRKYICLGDTVLLGNETSNSTATYSWAPATGLTTTNIPRPYAKPLVSTNYTLTVTNACSGIKTIDSTYIEILPKIAEKCKDVAIDEILPQANAIKIYPNPANNFITITYTTTENVYVTVTNTLGQQIHHTQLNPNQTSVQIDTRGFATGGYVFTFIQKDKNIAHQKVWIVR